MLVPYAFEGISTWLQRLDRFAHVVEQNERSTTSTTTNKSTTKKDRKSEGFTAEEKAAMRAARAKELKAAAEGEEAVLSALAAMSPDDRALGERVHAIVKENALDLTPKTWYGMPAYANKDGKVVLYFRNAEKFKERYAMLGVGR